MSPIRENRGTSHHTQGGREAGLEEVIEQQQQKFQLKQNLKTKTPRNMKIFHVKKLFLKLNL